MWAKELRRFHLIEPQAVRQPTSALMIERNGDET